MDRGSFLHGEINRRTPPPPLQFPIWVALPTINAVLIGDDAIYCDGLRVAGEGKVQELCRQLVARDVPADAALQVRWPDHTPAMLVESIHATAAFVEDFTPSAASQAAPEAGASRHFLPELGPLFAQRPLFSGDGL